MNRKEEIILATLDLAAKKGLGSVSMQQIADAVGITKASLYNHFASKEELVESMYETLRNQSKQQDGVRPMDYDALFEGRSMKEILLTSVRTYRSMCLDENMKKFYSIIISERAINRSAAEIMVSETKTMLHATKTLFYALQAKRINDFGDPDAAAFSFAMGVHSIIDYELDMISAGEEIHKDMLAEYVDEFCRIYGGCKNE